MTKLFFTAGCLSAFLGVALGAFAAHALKTRLEPDLFNIFEVGVRYQMYHSLGLLALAWACSYWNAPGLAWSGWAFIAGTVLFSGSLYILSLTGIRWLGAITPIGGLMFLFGWINLAWSVYKQP